MIRKNILINIGSQTVNSHWENYMKQQVAEMYKVYDLLREQISDGVPGAGYSYDQHCNILILLEDSGYGFQYIKYTLKNMFPYLQIYLMQACGYKGFKQTCNYIVNNMNKFKNGHIDYVIMQYDMGNQAFENPLEQNVGIDETVEALSILKNAATKISVFSPQCFEECLIQIKNLDQLINRNIDNNLYKQYQMMLSKQNCTIDFEGYTDKNQVEQVIETEIEKITDKQLYRINHQRNFMSGCWMRECQRCNPEHCKDKFNEKKCKYIACNQLIYLLLYNVEKYMGHRIYFNRDMKNIIESSDYIKQMWGDIQ